MDHELVLIAGAGLAIMIAASVFSRRTGVAAPLLLVALGIATSYLPQTPTIHVEPEVILAGVLPLLLYGSAVQLPVTDFRRNLSLISWLSVVMVIVSAIVIGLIVHGLFSEIPLALAIALGAVVSPTDAVAATAIGRRVGLPPRVMTVLEGESLVNDASALVVLRSAVAALAVSDSFSLGHAVLQFVWAVFAAVVVGVVVAWLTVHLRQRLDDPVLNTTISFAVPFLAYVPAEEVGASGVLAVVAAGVATGSLGSKRFSARDRQTQATTWSTITFVLESAVFLLMGYELPVVVRAAGDETTFGRIVGLVGVVVGLLVVLRFVGLAWPVLIERFGPDDRAERVQTQLDEFGERLERFEPQDARGETRLHWARRRLARGQADVAFEEREPLTNRGILAIAWAGMRGVVTVAAAQTIPSDTPQRASVVLAAFLVALITLVLFGLTLPPLIQRLNFQARSPEERRNDYLALLHQVAGDAMDAVGPLDEITVEDQPIDPELVTLLKERFVPRLMAGVTQIAHGKPGLREQSMIVQRRYLDAMRDALLSERSIGAYSSETYRNVESMLDREEQRLGTFL